MPKVLAVGSPKGGVGKSTVAYHLAMEYARAFGLRVLLVDADDNHSSADWADDGLARGHAVPFDYVIAAGSDAADLAHARTATDPTGTAYDLVIIDLPGAREDAWAAMLQGEQGRPVPDLMVILTKPRLMDLRPVIRVIDAEITPLRLGYVVLLNAAHRDSMHIAEARRDELRDELLINVCPVIVRDRTAYDSAHERGLTVFDYGGASNEGARQAETDMRGVAADIAARLHLRTPQNR